MCMNTIKGSTRYKFIETQKWTIRISCYQSLISLGILKKRFMKEKAFKQVE